MRALRSLCLLLAFAPWAAAADVDLVLRGGVIYDGSGADGRTGDVAIADGKIVAVGQVQGKAGRVIDCDGLVVAPGFIDLHTHCDSVATDATLRPNLNYLTQGCTTVVTGNCGGGAVDVADYFSKIDRQGAGTNVIHLVPHGSIRARAMGGENRAPTPAELEKIKQLLDQGMRDGAWGMSTGLIYAPGMFAKTDELIELSRVVAKHHGLYVSHIRNEAAELVDAVREALQIGREAGLPVQISHFKAVGRANWGKIRDAARLIDEARAAGQKVAADQYPYIATSTGIAPTLFPATQVPGGMKNFAKRIAADPEFKEAMRQLARRRLADCWKIVFASYKASPDYVGRSLGEIAEERNMDPEDLAIEVQSKGGASIVKFSLSEEDVRYAMTLPWVTTGSDGGPRVPDQTCPHPRSYGAFPRKIGRYAIQEHVISLAAAIRSASGLPADILELPGRGYLRAGYVADVVVFDPRDFIDRATFEKPHQYSTGVRYLLIGGKPAIDNSRPTGQLLGRAIRHGP